MSKPDTALAVLFADVSGSTRLYEKLGNAQALAAIGRCLDLVRAVCEGRGGRVVKTIGDEAMTVFGSVDDTAEAAAEVQAKLTELAPAGGTRLAMRIGFHFGPAIEADGDVYGDSVNVAARMVALAKAGQVITSSETVAALSPWLRSRFRELDSLTVKGKAQDVRICELLWQESADELTALSTRPASQPAKMWLRLGEREIELSQSQDALTLGRDLQCDVVIGDRMASRMHARIERRRDKFVLVDQSSNGTYVTVDGEKEILVRREELVLRGRGQISFGHAAQPGGTAEVLTFSCIGVL
ncbi:MAG TPA: adenylate/guanylate cyclase domain-containing protein [Casimicrobiaceae bacterium]|jgi:class 3 adenylate cyclase